MEKIMLTFNLVLLIGALFILGVYALIFKTRSANYGATKDGFLVSYRNMDTVVAAITIGIGWMWAPAFFISSFQSYTNGLVGLFYFAFGNILTLVLFSYGAQMIRDRLPNGYTFTGYIKEKHGDTLHRVYMFCMVIISVVAVCTLLVALSKMLSIVTGVNQTFLSIVTMISVFFLSFRIGYRASVFSDLIKFVAVYGVFGTFIAILFMNGYMPNFAGVGGHGFEFLNTPFAWTIFATFGGATILNHLSTPWIDNGFTQTAYSIKDASKVGTAFRRGALVFAGGIALTAMIGFIGVNAGVQIPKGDELYTLVYVIDQHIGRWALIPLVFAIIAGLLSVIDTFMCSISSIVTHDIASSANLSEKNAIAWGRISFVVVSIIAVIVASSGVNLLYMFLLQSVLKSSIGLATAALVLRPNWFHAKAVSPVLMFSIVTALVAYIICDYLNIPGYQLYLAAGFCFGTPVAAYLTSKLAR